MNLDPLTIWLIGIATVAFVSVVTFFYKRTGRKPSTVVLQWFAFAVSCGIALVAGAPVIPPLDLGGDPSQVVAGLFLWLTDFVAAVGPFFTYATLIYTTLWKQVAEKLPTFYRKLFKKP